MKVHSHRFPRITLRRALSLLAAVSFSPLGVMAEEETYSPAETEQIKDLGKEAIHQLVATFPREFTGTDVSRAAVLPVQRDIDEGYFTMQVGNAFSQVSNKTGMEIYTRDDAKMATVLDEIGWNQSYRDAIDPATVVELGRLRGADAVFFTRLDVTKFPNGAINVRANIEAYETETGRKLWGDEGSLRGSPVLTRDQLIRYGAIAGIVLALFLVWLWIRSALRKARRPR